MHCHLLCLKSPGLYYLLFGFDLAKLQEMFYIYVYLNAFFYDGSLIALFYRVEY